MSVTAYVKLTNRCNVGCAHCYLSEEVRADKSVMSKDTMKRTAAFLAEMREAQSGDLHVVFHGGEPLSLHPDTYYQMGDILDEYIATHTESIQTSLIPYSSRYADLIHNRFNGEVGSSIDFSQRQIKGSAESYQTLWLKKVAQARSDGILVVPGMVPGKAEIPRAAEIVSWMLEHGFSIFNVERYNAFGIRPLDWPSNLQHSHFLTDLFNDVLGRFERNAFTPYIRVLAAAIGGVLYQNPGDRWGGSCQSEFVVIEPDGSLNNCPDKSSHELPYGKAHEGFAAFAASPERRRTIRLQLIDHKKSHCHECENNAWCKSGCPITPNGEPDGQHECSGYKTFLNHVREFVSDDRGFVLANRYLRMNPLSQKEAA